MSHKITLTIVAVAMFACATVAINAASAMEFRRGDGGHPPVHHLGHIPHWHEHVHLRPVFERVYVRPVGYSAVVEPGPCTCLWKGYTPDGTVVFKDLCTKEMASAPVDSDAAQVTDAQNPSNFAGRTYQDYLAVNPQSPSPAQPDAPAAPQKN